MEIKNYANPVHGADKQTSLTDLLNILEKTCQNCNPLTPITCVTGCKTWKLKNQFRKLHEKTKNPKFMTKLLNTLKNKRRLQILETISKEHSSIMHIQQRLKKQGFDHSQQTIIEEYINPLTDAGLAGQDQNLYYAIIFGCKISELVKDFHNLEDILPPHSECYEEITLDRLMKGSKTYEDLRSTIPSKSVARVLSRLQKAELAETRKEKDYIFFFTTKRNPEGSLLSPTESRVYNNIPTDGIPARKLAEKTGISLRRTYKYLRKLKGKKLVFTRKKPTSYRLTTEGSRIAIMLEAMRNLTAEASATAQLAEHEKSSEQVAPDTYPKRKTKKSSI
jgi:predicted transcriptional regulator